MCTALAKCKPKKLSWIAVCKKHLRIYFGVVKNKMAYQPGYEKTVKLT